MNHVDACAKSRGRHFAAVKGKDAYGSARWCVRLELAVDNAHLHVVGCGRLNGRGLGCEEETAQFVKGKVQIGRIDLTPNCSFFEVPEASAGLVLKKMSRAMVGNRQVVVDDADPTGDKPTRRGSRRDKSEDRRPSHRAADKASNGRRKYGKDDWKQFFE